MKKDKELITGHYKAAENLIQDVGRNNFTIISCDDFLNRYPLEKYPSNYLKKCSHVTIATSGDDRDGHDWMLIMPYRIDHSGSAGDKVIDRDPTLIVLDGDTLQPAETGIIKYHQDYPNRTTPLSGYTTFTEEQTVKELRDSLETGTFVIEEAPQDLLDSMHHMVDAFKQKFPKLVNQSKQASEDRPTIDLG